MHRTGFPRVSAALSIFATLGLALPACSGGTGESESDGTETAGTETETESGTETGEVQIPDGCDMLFVGGRDDREAISTALIEAEDNTTICFSGTFEITTDRLSTSDKNGLHLRGVDEGDGIGAGARFDFMDTVGPVGMEFQNMTNITIEGITIANAKGDAVEVRGSENVIFRDVNVVWERGKNTENGAYGFYPVESTNVLIDRCEASFASDAGIYVGQSNAVIVRETISYSNVSGIQIENTTGSEAYNNETWDNAVGMLIHDLPGLTVINGGSAWIHDNNSHDNNGENFADSGIFAANLPSGVGIMFLALDHVEANGNESRDNNTAGVLIASFETVKLLLSESPEADPEYDPYPETYDIHDNTLAGNGGSPAGLFKDLGLTQLADLVWDGSVDTSKDNSDGSLNLCFRNNTGATFMELYLPNPAESPTDPTPYECEHPPVGPVDNGLD